MGEKWPREFCRKWRLPRHFWVLLHALKHDMGQTALLPLRRKACWGCFRPKNPTASAEFEPAKHINHTLPFVTLLLTTSPFFHINYYMPVPVAERSEAWVWGRSLAGILVRIPSGAWMSVCCEFCVLSGRGLCDGLITRPEESYWL
jgi:hypothetical protein